MADFVVALCSEECLVSRELFSAGGGRAARTIIAMVPRYCHKTTPEGYLAHFDKVLGTTDELFVSKDTLDLVSYAIKHATETDVGVISLEG
jgi:hypothetical protein